MMNWRRKGFLQGTVLSYQRIQSGQNPITDKTLGFKNTRAILMEPCGDIALSFQRGVPDSNFCHVIGLQDPKKITEKGDWFQRPNAIEEWESGPPAFVESNRSRCAGRKGSGAVLFVHREADLKNAF
jgi:hypothetical protein